MVYELKPGYISRIEPTYFNDALPDSTAWQADVYRLAAALARKVGAKRLVDLGCGRGGKLAPYSREFEIVGVDFGSNIEQCRRDFGGGEWIAADLNTQIVPPDAFTNAVVICADVIEHLPSPDALIDSLRNACLTARYVLVSTPDRLRVHRRDHDGPPVNPYHIREWTLQELTDWFQSKNLPIRWTGWTISNDARPDQVHTSLIVLSATEKVDALPLTFQPAPGSRKVSRISTSNRLKVWMTPTPSEAGRDTTNAIHQVVCRLDGLLPDYDVELVEQPDNADLRVAHAGQGSDAPVDVAHYHGLYNTAGGHNNNGFFAINSHVIQNLRSAKLVTAPSEWIADVIRRDMHVSPEIVGWGVDTDEWTPVKDPHVYVLWNKARVDAVSDPTPMLELAARANDTLFLTTFGEGTPNVKTIGRQPYEVMKNHVRNAGVYLATVTETFGIATVEAMAAGVPILGFRHGNTAHLVEHGVTGFLAEPGDMDGLYEGLQYCLKYRDILGANAREAAKQHTWARVAERMAAIYRRALEPHVGAKCSVIIPCHNYGVYVGEAIESALSQETASPFEIIVVLDRCTDNSAEVVARYANRGVQAITVDHGNLSATRNSGIQHATGEYVACLDADDRIGNPHFLRVLAEALDADRTLGIAFTSIRVMDADGKLGHLNAWPNGFDFDKQAQRQNQIPSLCLFRKEAWRRAGGFRPYFIYAQDAEFWTTVGAIGYGARHVVQDGWFHYRLHNKSQSQVHRTGEIPEPDWVEFHPWTKDGGRPFAAGGKPPLGSWPVRFYLNPDVSIVIPVGPGHEELLKDALHSVEGQTHRMWDCIVVNDTGKPLCLEGFPWAQVVATRGCVGAGAARNLGAKQAHAPFIVFLDADDMLKPRFLELTLKAYRQNGRYAYTDWFTQNDAGIKDIHPTPEYSFDAIWQQPSIHPVTALIPRQWFEAVGGFDESLSSFEDVDLFMKLLTKGYCGVRVPEPLLLYNLHYGKRRVQGEKQQAKFKTLLTQRYGEYMEGNRMCNCVEPPKGKPPVPPTVDNVADYREAYGEMVKIQFTWEYAPEGATVFKGPATRVAYGRRAKNDVFYIWQKDYENDPTMFTVVESYETEPEVTVVPPEPSPLVESTWQIEPTAIVTVDGIEVPGIVEEFANEPPSEPEIAFDGIQVQEGFASEPEPMAKVQIKDVLGDMTNTQLREYAKDNDINLAGAKNHDSLIAAIEAHYRDKYRND